MTNLCSNPGCTADPSFALAKHRYQEMPLDIIRSSYVYEDISTIN